MTRRLTTDRVAELQDRLHEAHKAWRTAESQFDKALRAEAAAFEAWQKAERAYNEACGLKELLTRSVEGAASS